MKTTVALCALLVGCSSSDPDTGDEVRVGLLLPYTGKDGAAGANYERGVIMAAEKVNAAGGLARKPLRIIFSDTHSSFDRGMDAAQKMVDDNVSAIIGPENDELARRLSPVLDNAGVPLLTPSSSSFSGISGRSSLWFRLAPSAKDLGIALGREMKANGAKRVVVINSTDEYETAFVNGVTQRLKASNVATVASVEISPGAASFVEPLTVIKQADPDAIVLAADALTASRFVNEFVVAKSRKARWYLSPSLEQEAFVLNSFPEVVEGMTGVAADVIDNDAQTQAFTDEFVARWKGSTPTTGAFFYYDAMALFAVAYEGAAADAKDGKIVPADLREHVLSASGQSGLVVKWDELQKGVTKARGGTLVDYSGVTGVIQLDEDGAREAVYTRFWTITGGAIVQQK